MTLARRTHAHPWHWNRQQRRAAVAFARITTTGLWGHLPTVLPWHVIDRGNAIAGRMARAWEKRK